MVVVVVMVVVVTDSEAWAKAVAAGLGDWDSQLPFLSLRNLVSRLTFL